MQPTIRATQGMDHTDRYKPSKELILITKRKMDEANLIIAKLEGRLKASQSTTEKAALVAKLDEVKKTYDGYIQELKVEQEAAAEPLPRAKEPKMVDLKKHVEEVKDTTQDACSYRPSSKQQPEIPRAAQSGQEVLQHRLQMQQGDQQKSIDVQNWSELQKKLIQSGIDEEQKKIDDRKQKVVEYRQQLADEVAKVDHIKTHKVECIKTRPKSPKIYESSFNQIGQVDMARKAAAEEQKKKLKDEFEQSLKEEQQRKIDAVTQRRAENTIDFSTGVLPSDRMDKDGKVSKRAIPDCYVEGQVFSNQVKEAPVKTNKVADHNLKKQQELFEIEEDRKIQQRKDERDQAIKQKKQETIESFQKQTTVALDVNQAHKQKTIKDKCGSIPYADDDDITHDNYYQTMNRRLVKQPNPKEDVVFDEGNFISRIDKADAQRGGKHAQVLPLTDEEKQAIDYKKLVAKNPQKQPLHEADVQIIKDYIDHAHEHQQFMKKGKEAQQTYHQDLKDFEQTVQERNHDEITEKEAKMLTAPRLVKPPF